MSRHLRSGRESTEEEKEQNNTEKNQNNFNNNWYFSPGNDADVEKMSQPWSTDAYSVLAVASNILLFIKP